MKKQKSSIWLGGLLSFFPQAQAANGIKSDFFITNIGAIFKGGAEVNSLVMANDLAAVISVTVQILLVVAGSIAVIFLIVGGYRYIVAHGNEEETESAKKTITSAILGLIIIALAFVIINIVIEVLLKGRAGTGIP